MSRRQKIYPTKLVKGCCDCPFKNYDPVYAVMACNLTSEAENDWVVIRDEDTMNNCPLNDGAIKIEVKKG